MDKIKDDMQNNNAFAQDSKNNIYE